MAVAFTIIVNVIIITYEIFLKDNTFSNIVIEIANSQIKALALSYF